MKKTSLLLLALLLSACTPNAGNQTTNQNAPTQTPTSSIEGLPTPSPSSAAGATLLQPVTMQLLEQSNSGESGTALLQDYGHITRVTITLTGKKSTTPQPAHIHAGDCKNPGEILYRLNDVVDGKSDTIIGAEMGSLFATQSMSVNVHKSETESNVYMACGDILKQ